MDYWFTADHHFYHKNIIKHAKRPFDLEDEPSMREALIEAWNAVVRPGDMVCHVGDFAWTKRIDLVDKLIEQLHGQIHIVYGNHDERGVKESKKFASAGYYNEVKVLFGPTAMGPIPLVTSEQLIVLLHYSMEIWNKSHYGSWHLYGHSHDGLAPNLARKSFDVGVDATAKRIAFNEKRETLDPMDYRPINFDEVAEIMRQHRWWRPIDHHKKKQ